MIYNILGVIFFVTLITLAIIIMLFATVYLCVYLIRKIQDTWYYQ